MAESKIKQAGYTIKRGTFEVITGDFGETYIDGTKFVIKVIPDQDNYTALIYDNGTVAFRSIVNWQPLANTTVSGTFYYIE